MNHWKPHWTDLDSVFCAGETHAIHLCGVVFGVPAICDGTSTGPPAMSAQPMLPVPQRGNDLNEALSSFSDPSEVGHIWWLYLVIVAILHPSQLVPFLACCVSSSRFMASKS